MPRTSRKDIPGIWDKKEETTEYRRITDKGGVNTPVKLRRPMGMEPRDVIELEVNDRDGLVIRIYQARCIYCGSGEIHLRENDKGVCRVCTDQLIDEYVKQERKELT